MRLINLFRRNNRGKLEGYRNTLWLDKTENEKIMEYLESVKPLDENRMIFYYDTHTDDSRTIRIALISRNDGYYIEPMLLDGVEDIEIETIQVSGNLKTIEILPLRKEMVGTYLFTSDKTRTYELKIGIERRKIR